MRNRLMYVAVATGEPWTIRVGRSLVCDDVVAPSDVIVVENFDPNYLLFECAAALQEGGFAARAIVPVQDSHEGDGVNAVSRGIAELMASHARMHAWTAVPIAETEPITLNAATQIRNHLAGQHVGSLILVTPAFRSERSSRIYRAVLEPLGTRVYCAPVFGTTTPEHWTRTWHGIQQVTQEFLKLQYYRFCVLPFVGRSRTRRPNERFDSRVP